ncbi:MAG: discoidin domain-containing protein [Bacteroidales bacterium]|nr:discoidin domain-containing protein [Bacteroidales bacterium]
MRLYRRPARLFLDALLVSLLVGCAPQHPDSSYSRGIGVYPGDPAAYTGPQSVPAGRELRNLALHRLARHSSSYDYNLTAQLLTDGIVAQQDPYWMSLEINGVPVARKDREKPFDDNTVTALTLPAGNPCELTLFLHGGTVRADRLCLTGRVEGQPGPCLLAVEVSSDGKTWTPAGEERSAVQPSRAVPKTYHGQAYRNFIRQLELPAEPFAAIRLRLDAPSVQRWSVQQLDFSLGGEPVSVLPSAHFCSAWMSEGSENEWVCVDLGAEAALEQVRLDWLSAPAEGNVEISSDGQNWTSLGQIPAGGGRQELPLKGRGRFVRLSGLKAAEDHLVLSEMEVWGRGGVVPQAQPGPQPGERRFDLRGGDWHLRRAGELTASGETLSDVGYDVQDWLPATVPGTVLTSYFNAGAIPDQRFDDDQLQISESYFLDDFWYRDTFELPENWTGKELVLHFDGIDWKAEVFVNGTAAGRIEGAFTRAAFDVTELLHPGRNALAVKILKNAHPGIVKEQDRFSADLNGGVLGADNPTMHATIGWDWIPTVRGRNIGIWNDVYLTALPGGISIDDVFVDTDLPLPSTDYTDLRPVVTLTNHAAQSREASVRLRYGELEIRAEAVLEAGQTRDIVLPSARLERPELWWPAGYGAPHLYEVETEVSVDGVPSDVKRQFSGVREMSYTMDGGVLDFYVNGRRLIGNGGNWGYPEINLNYRAREYDIAAAYHADMHFTMIRNWVGMTGDEEFWEACDRHGVMVWQDFWLANPADGPEPDDEAMFLANAEDFLRKIRHHPCLALYCGRNEGNPPASLDAGLAALVSRLHPGMQYIPHSADGPVSGGGPYRALPVAEYFSMTRGADRFHSERGMPNVPTLESLERMLGPDHRWPQDGVWGMHDYALESAQSAATFNAMVEKAFGRPESLEQFAEWAQWIDYEGYRAIFESRSAQRKGIQLWMSHSCWPSMVWQTYDYYFAPTAAYFGAKKGSAPVRIQWNPAAGQVEVVNNNAGDLQGLTARAVLATLDGTVLSDLSAGLDAPEDATVPGLPSVVLPDTGPVLLRLILSQADRRLADNFYVLNPADPGDYSALRSLPGADVRLACDFRREGGEWKGVVTLENRSEVPALMLRLNLVGSRSGEQILPVFYEDNWISLLPGESRQVLVRCADADTRGERPRLVLSGFNQLQ